MYVAESKHLMHQGAKQMMTMALDMASDPGPRLGEGGRRS
jgi:hypothetical protein